jgi:hypothetical protein
MNLPHCGSRHARRELRTRLDSSAHPGCSRPIRSVALMLALLMGATGCVTKFRTGAPLDEAQRSVVATDLGMAGVLARRPGGSGAKLPEASARFARLSGSEDRSAAMTEDDLEILLASPSALRGRVPKLRSLASQLGHRYALVGEASTAPTDERKNWIIQILVPIPFLWISFGIPVEYAATADAPHATVSARVIDLETGELLAASFELGSSLDADETPPLNNSAVSRALNLMSVERP